MVSKSVPRRVRRARSGSLIANLVIALVGLVALAGAGMLAPILWTALTGSAQPQARACDSLEGATERGACLEVQGRRNPPAR
jgi:hypothetical protein